MQTAPGRRTHHHELRSRILDRVNWWIMTCSEAAVRLMDGNPLELSLTADASRGRGESFRDGEAVTSGHKEAPVTHLRRLTLDEIARRNYTEIDTADLLLGR
jgi:hypothetical protein